MQSVDPGHAKGAELRLVCLSGTVNPMGLKFAMVSLLVYVLISKWILDDDLIT